MTRKYTILAATLIATITTASTFAQGDLCSTATPLVGTPTTTVDTTVATTSGFDGADACTLGASTINQDLFWQWTAPLSGSYTISTLASDFNPMLSVHAGVGCGSVCVAHNDNSGPGLEARATLQVADAGDTYLIQVGGAGGQAGTGFLRVRRQGVFCPPLPPDALEPNDACAAAAILTEGLFTDLTVGPVDTDFYEFTVLPGEIVDVDIFPIIGFAETRIFDNACVQTAISFGGFEYHNASNVPETIAFEVFSASSLSDCTVYNLELSTSPADCPAGPDAFEESDDCPSAHPLASGFYPGLNASSFDHDYYAVTVADGATLEVTITFLHANGNFNLHLWDPSVACDTNVSVFGAIASSTSFNDFESLSYTNSTGAPLELVAEVEWC